MSLLQNSNAISEGGYNIANSLRFQSASSQYGTRTFGTPTDNKKWTYSAWVKRGALTTLQTLLNVGVSSNYDNAIGITTSGQIEIVDYRVAGGYIMLLQTTAVYRDPSAWYHIFVSFDSTQATASDRVKVFVNGVQVTSFASATYPPLNHQMYLGANGLSHQLGRNYAGIGYCDLYLTEQYWVDGQALTPSSFGETDTLTGQWVAKKYNGTYGTNGFYLPFSNGTSTTTLGADGSGNSNNWTLTNFTRSAGVNDCWMYDVPSGNGSSVGGTQPNSNYAVMNPLVFTNGLMSYNSANLNYGVSAPNNKIAHSTMTIPLTGKWYFESQFTSGTQTFSGIGISDGTVSQTGTGFSGGKTRLYQRSGNKATEAGATAYGATYTNGDVIGVAVDMDAGTLTFYKNGVSQGTAYTDTAGFSWHGAVYVSESFASSNFGQRSFAYTPPSGFKALCTANLPASTIVKGNQYMDATTYTGNGTSQNITNAGSFSPDLVWIKCRNAVGNHELADSIRGIQKYLRSNTTDAEISDTNSLQSFNSNGFTVGIDGDINGSGETFVAWQWDAGSSTVTNTSGTISSQVRANPTAGVSVVTYTGTGANATVGHGLGVAPKMVIVKNRASAIGWQVRHASVPVTQTLELQDTAAAYNSTVWNNTAPTSTVFSLGTGLSINNSGQTYVAYCFAEIAGFSKFGSYTGNGSADGPFVYCGFRPKFVMVKPTSYADDWLILDSSRDTYNVTSNYLRPNLSNSEGSAGVFDFTANGFKVRFAGGAVNTNAATMIFMAFAENPFAQSNAR